MGKLPFVVQPRLKAIKERIGSEDAGYIEIERRGYLTSGEKSFVQQIQQQELKHLLLLQLLLPLKTVIVLISSITQLRLVRLIMLIVAHKIW